MTQPNETEVYKKALGNLTQQVARLTLDLALAHAQIEQLTAAKDTENEGGE